MTAAPPPDTEVSPPQALIGHDEVLDRMARNLSAGRLHHGWLLSGPDGIGKFKAALHLAAWLLSAPDQSAGNLFAGDEQNVLIDPRYLDPDHPEVRLALTQTHPDLLIIKPSEDEKNKSGQIKTEQVRELNSFFAHSAGRGGWRVAIIDSLDLVNRNGQNAMLKILEEPPRQSLLLVLNNRSGAVLPTIRSRCTQAVMSPLSQADTIDVLTGLWPSGDEGYIRVLAGLSGGAPGQAVRLAEAEAAPLFEASCRLLSDPATREEDFWAIADKWGPGGNKGRAVRTAALFLFDKLLTTASVMAAGAGGAGTPRKDDFAALEFVSIAVEALSRHSQADVLARLHQDFCADLRQAERLFLDFSPVFAKFLCKLHSQTRTE